MNKFFGKIGYGITTESIPGVWSEEIIEKFYYGDIIKNSRNLEENSVINDNIVISNSISIVADAYAYEHFFNIRYIEWLGVKWTVKKAEIQRPRLILTIGGQYNSGEKS